MRDRFRQWRRLDALLPLLLLLAAGLAGCVVNTAPGGQVQFGLDDAELFGQAVDGFRLPDGSEGKVRVLQGRYSVKLPRQLRVVHIEGATRVRVVSSQQVGGRTLLVLEKSERGCDQKTQLMSILGAEVLSWDFGDCQTVPQASMQPDHAVFDFVQPRRTVRYTYRDGKLLRGEFDTLAGGQPPAGPIGAQAPRYQPGPPVPAGTLAGAARAEPATPVPAAPAAPAERKPAAAAPAARPAAPAKSLEFPALEQKPVRIVLDK